MKNQRSIWPELWRLLAVAAIGLFAFFISLGLELDENPGLHPAPVAVDLQLGITCFILVAARRRAPIVTTLIIAALSGFSAAALGPLLLAMVSLATQRRHLRSFSAVLVAAGSAGLATLTAEQRGTAAGEIGPLWVALFVVVILLLPVLIGNNIGFRRELISSLRAQVRAATAERQAHAAATREAERTRIAQELHDELGHRLSLIALHAGALEYRSDIDPEQVRQSAGILRTSAQQALTDLRATLGMLRSGATEEPSPDLWERITGVVAETRAAGSPVVLSADDDLIEQLGSLSPAIGRHLFRVIQECLTNARRHAPTAEIRLQLTGAPGERIEVRTSNPKTTDSTADGRGSGYGLVGIEERVRVAEGQLRIREDDASRFTVEVWLPWTK